MLTDHIRPTVARIALTMLSAAPRKTFRRVDRPSDDQALAIACKMIDLGIDCDEHDILLAFALLNSKVTIDDIRTCV